MAAVAGGQSPLSTLSPNTYNCAAYISTTTTLFILPPAAQLRGGCRASLSVSASMRDAEALIRSGEVVSVSPKQSQPLVSTGGYKILDVRPVWEKEKAFVSGSYHIPLFVEDEDMSLITLLKKWIHFGYIGIWMGHRLTVENDQFVQQVQKVVPRKEEKLLVACGEGLRLRTINEERTSRFCHKFEKFSCRGRFQLVELQEDTSRSQSQRLASIK